MAQAGAERLAIIVKGVTSIMTGASLARVQRHVGFAGKGAALLAASKTLGGDRAMSNFRGGKVRLNAGWDAVPNGVKINLRPPGLWVLAEDGRKSSGSIKPKRRHEAVVTPDGPRAHSSYGKSRGVKSVTRAQQQVDAVAGRATDEAVRRELARVVH